MKTVHPVGEALLNINFVGAKIASIGRGDPKSASCTFHCVLGKGMGKLFEKMGWEVPGEKCSMEKLDGKLDGGHFIMTGSGDPDQLKLKSTNGKVNTDAEVEIDFGSITDFACYRFEIEGRKGKGFRHELRFKATVKNEDGMALLESYMSQTGNGKGNLKVAYLKESVQEVLIPDVQAHDQQEVLETEPEEPKRGKRTN